MALKRDKLIKTNQLVQEQLQAAHMVPSTIPWNTPIFLIPKKSGKWHLLHDLWAINAVIKPLGTLQPGTTHPTLLSKDLDLIVTDLKD